MSSARPWHQLFGLSWQDFFQDTAVEVELERDLSKRTQFLDVVIHCPEPGPPPRRPPDGFEDLGRHNLVTFKSYQESLDGWALNELVGHYVNHRKQTGPTTDDPPPEEAFRLFAVCVRRPRELSRRGMLKPVSPGVYEARHFTGKITVVVVHELPLVEHNAVLHLFSADATAAEYGATRYRPHSRLTSTLLLKFVERYETEGLDMVGKELLELHRETMQELLSKMTIEERLAGVPAEQRLAGMPAEQRLAGMPAEQRLAGLPAEQRLAGLTDDDLRSLSPEVRDSLLRRLLGNPSDPPTS
ncbi:MAG: hypothetical protein ACRDD1_15395 [Planctomycetia bacterium]